MLRHSLPPVAAPNARLLILGSMPGVRSLGAQQYYAQPRNAFWPIMGRWFGAGPEKPYDDRLKILQQNRIALWDVLQSCHRPGSLDSAIRVVDAVPNDFAQFLATYSAIMHVFFNGVAAGGLFQRLVAARGLAPQRPITYATLPSTSPANARMRFDEKSEAWRQAVQLRARRVPWFPPIPTP
jgi:double-stranded uracil-DNA glycosylase